MADIKLFKSDPRDKAIKQNYWFREKNCI